MILKKTTTLIVAALASTAIAAGSANAAVIINVGDPLIPTGLGAGDSFHLVFALDKSSFSSTNTVAAFNTYVTDAANNTGSFTGGNSVVAGLGANWFVIGSEIDTTPVTGFTIHARDNALVTAGVYLINGEQVATGYADMWDGTIMTAIDIEKDGVTIAGVGTGFIAHTGTNADGTANARSLGPNSGQTRVRRGYAQTDSGWINGGDEAHQSGRGVYALSELITIVAVPEPGSLALLGLGCALIAGRRRGSMN
ncbi:MAG: PEP-CTERM sorting domain-containing protein [Phycisphaera sp.]|nr:PEP-CTERM sorting domain-containing protein [Phycisphaera sp.]